MNSPATSDMVVYLWIIAPPNDERLFENSGVTSKLPAFEETLRSFLDDLKNESVRNYRTQ